MKVGINIISLDCRHVYLATAATAVIHRDLVTSSRLQVWGFPRYSFTELSVSVWSPSPLRSALKTLSEIEVTCVSLVTVTVPIHSSMHARSSDVTRSAWSPSPLRSRAAIKLGASAVVVTGLAPALATVPVSLVNSFCYWYLVDGNTSTTSDNNGLSMFCFTETEIVEGALYVVRSSSRLRYELEFRCPRYLAVEPSPLTERVCASTIRLVR